MPKCLGIAVLLLVALAAISPFFHTDKHPADCAVCTFAAAGNAPLAPASVELLRPILDFWGFCPSSVVACRETGIPVRGSRAPPIAL